MTMTEREHLIHGLLKKRAHVVMAYLSQQAG